MGWIEHFFSKNADEVEAADIMRFFRQGHREGQNLEFKSGSVRIEKIMKVVGGFLNATGGLLIVGAPREQDIPGMEEDRNSFGEPDPNQNFDSQRLYATILQGIHPTPRGLKITTIKFNKGSIFLIEVPKSDYPPHQVYRTGTYYLRKADATRPARHEEVEQMFLSHRKAQLELELKLERGEDAVSAELKLANLSNIAAHQPAVVVEAWPTRNNERPTLQEHIRWPDIYLAKGQSVQQTLSLYPSQTVLFLKVQYFCVDVMPHFKAAFISIEHRKAGLLEVFDSKAHHSFSLWYDQHSYLLNEN